MTSATHGTIGMCRYFHWKVVGDRFHERSTIDEACATTCKFFGDSEWADGRILFVEILKKSVSELGLSSSVHEQTDRILQLYERMLAYLEIIEHQGEKGIPGARLI